MSLRDKKTSNKCSRKDYDIVARDFPLGGLGATIAARGDTPTHAARTHHSTQQPTTMLHGDTTQFADAAI